MSHDHVDIFWYCWFGSVLRFETTELPKLVPSQPYLLELKEETKFMVEYPEPEIRRFSNILLVVLGLSIYSVKIGKYGNWYTQIEIVRKTITK